MAIIYIYSTFSYIPQYVVEFFLSAKETFINLKKLHLGGTSKAHDTYEMHFANP